MSTPVLPDPEEVDEYVPELYDAEPLDEKGDGPDLDYDDVPHLTDEEWQYVLDSVEER